MKTLIENAHRFDDGRRDARIRPGLCADGRRQYRRGGARGVLQATQTSGSMRAAAFCSPDL